MALEEQAAGVAALLRLIANKNRLLILCALEKAPCTVSELHALVPDISQPALSQHLALLKAADVVDSVKCAQSVRYSISDERIRKVMATLRTNYCPEG